MPRSSFVAPSRTQPGSHDLFSHCEVEELSALQNFFFASLVMKKILEERKSPTSGFCSYVQLTVSLHLELLIVRDFQ